LGRRPTGAGRLAHLPLVARIRDEPIPMRSVRRISQWLTFLVFAFLFLNTEYKDNDVLPYAVNVFLRMDPLVAAAAVLAGRALVVLVWPALVILGLTVVFGRFFCGWICPLGATLDAVSATVFRKAGRRAGVPPSWGRAKYLLLFALLASAVFTLQWVFFFDPISLLIRSLAVAVYPALNLAVRAVFDALYATGWTAVTQVSEPVYGFLRAHFLAFEQPHFQAALPVAVVFLVVLGLEWVDRRFWCRNLCPLGALFGLLGRLGLVRRVVSEPDCVGCGLCARSCSMGAVGEGYVTTDRAECTACMDCEALCPEQAIRFGRERGQVSVPLDLGRRGVLASLAAGVTAVPLLGASAEARLPNPRRIRPPGALSEQEFLARCTRCGECMRVCVANGLQPAWAEVGLAGLWSPVLVPRIGYCEYNCTLCGQVCPTGAIQRLPVEEKRQVKIGLAEVDRSHCLPWKGDADCIVCEEHCPTPEKAIRLRDERVMTMTGEVRTFKRPYVDERLCVGCGICETKCPLVERPAITVSSRGESRAGPAAVPYG